MHGTFKKIKADPLTLESLIAWLEKRPAHVEYCYADNDACLLGQYFTAMGFDGVIAGSDCFSHGEGMKDIHFPPSFDEIAIGHPRTFGGALERARAALTS